MHQGAPVISERIDSMSGKTRKGTLLYLFGIILFSFGLILTASFGIIAYRNEASTYKAERLDMTRNVTELVENLIKEDPDDFVRYVNFYKSHCQDMKIDVNNIGYKDDYDEFITGFTEQYPGSVLGRDIAVPDLPYELQLDYYEYKHEYWLSVFEDARKSMNLMYLYFTIPDETTHEVLYVIDVERAPREDDPEHMMLGDNVANDPDKFAIEWNTWSTGKQGEFQMVDNEWGHVYTYYDPLVINRKKVGLINADIQFEAVNENILKNSINLTVRIMLLMLVCVALLLLLLYLIHLKKIIGLTECVKEFSDTQNPAMSGVIRDHINGNTELEELAYQTADMIENIDKHVNELLDTYRALDEAQNEAATASAMATMDALTGVRNKLAYDGMCKDIDYRIADGFTDFGIIMIDLNFLKRINDTYGHDKGNVSIKLLCDMVCNIFVHSPVFRIGGDEFVVILENDDFIHREERFKELQDMIGKTSADDSLPVWERISAAAGMAIFDPDIDHNIDNVFKRADQTMYENKKKMKALRDR